MPRLRSDGTRMNLGDLVLETSDDEFAAALAELSALADAVLAHARLAERMSADIAAVADMVDDLKVADE